jgi:hypothetical protein
MLFLSGFSMLISPVAGKWVDRSGFRPPLMAGTGLMLVGAGLLTTLFVGASVPIMAGVLTIVGISYGLNNVSLQAAMIKATPPGMIGTTSGLFQASRYMGSIYVRGRSWTGFWKRNHRRTFPNPRLYFAGCERCRLLYDPEDAGNENGTNVSCKPPCVRLTVRIAIAQ